MAKAVWALLAAGLLGCEGCGPKSSDLLEVAFDPAEPVYHAGSSLVVHGTTVYDHSSFSVTLRNRHPKAVRILRVLFTSIGNRETSGLGDIVNYWSWPDADRALAPGGSITFHKVWGFVTDTPNTEMTYRFDVYYLLEDESGEVLSRKELRLAPGTE